MEQSGGSIESGVVDITLQLRTLPASALSVLVRRDFLNLHVLPASTPAKVKYKRLCSIRDFVRKPAGWSKLGFSYKVSFSTCTCYRQVPLRTLSIRDFVGKH